MIRGGGKVTKPRCLVGSTS